MEGGWEGFLEVGWWCSCGSLETLRLKVFKHFDVFCTFLEVSKTVQCRGSAGKLVRALLMSKVVSNQLKGVKFIIDLKQHDPVI